VIQIIYVDDIIIFYL